MGVFQRTFSVSLNASGKPVAVLCPSPVGPRNCGQLSAARKTVGGKARQTKKTQFNVHRMKDSCTGSQVAVPYYLLTRGSDRSDGSGRFVRFTEWTDQLWLTVLQRRNSASSRNTACLTN